MVLIHEAWGLDVEMRKHADRLARSGYLTLAPDLYSQGGARCCMVSTLLAMSSGWRTRARSSPRTALVTGMLRGAPVKLSAALEKAGAVHDVKGYPNAGGPEPESAAQEWRRIEAFFAEHLSAGRTR